MHTLDGDLIVHFRSHDVIHTGDLFSNGFYPNIDASSLGWIGGMIAAADRILKLAGPKTRIIPGHGPMATPEELAASPNVMLVDGVRPPGPDARRRQDHPGGDLSTAYTRPRRCLGQGPFYRVGCSPASLTTALAKHRARPAASSACGRPLKFSAGSERAASGQLVRARSEVTPVLSRNASS